MKLYRYWVRCTREMPNRTRVTTFGYSNTSEAAARECGEGMLKVVAQIRDGSKTDWEYTHERVIREEILEELAPDTKVTRNRYGAEILNTERVVFVDIDGELGDGPPASGGLFGKLKRFFTGGKAESPAGRPEGPSKTPLEIIAERLAPTPYRSLPTRLYKTHAGYRLLLLNSGLLGGDCKPLMKACGADSLYCHLCIYQRCYRARLTPKPKRIGMAPCRFSYPPENDFVQKQENGWVAIYHEKMAPYAVCRLIGSLNWSDELSAEPIVAFHDERTKALSTLPLA